MGKLLKLIFFLLLIVGMTISVCHAVSPLPPDPVTAPSSDPPPDPPPSDPPLQEDSLDDTSLESIKDQIP